MGKQHGVRGWLALGLVLGGGLVANACGGDAKNDTKPSGGAGETTAGGESSAGSSGAATTAGSNSSDAGAPSSTDGGTGSAAGGSEADAGAGGAEGGAGGGDNGRCPAEPPVDATACDNPEQPFICSWGATLRPECRASASCFEGEWYLDEANECEAPSIDCPSDPTAPPTDICDSFSGWCAYPQSGLACDCRGDNMPVGWWCSESPGADCPLPVPQLGSDCDSTATCRYKAVLCTEYEIECVNGAWRLNGLSSNAPCD